jgi:hypothetical protein
MDVKKKTLIGDGFGAAALIAGLLAGMGMHGGFGGRAATRAPRRTRTPMMITSTPAVIAAWNDSVMPRNKKRGLKKPKRTYATGQHPKFPKDRVHKQHKHPLRDENGAYTLVGRGKPSSQAFASLMSLRRMWLAGISAQRGY